MTRWLLFLAIIVTIPGLSLAWQAGGVPVCTDPAGQGSPCIAKTSDGFVVGWTDARPGSFYDIYSQKLNGSGVPLWTLNGAPVCTQESLQNRPLVAPGLNGSAILIWDDFRLMGDFTHNPWTYGQRLNANGVSRWTINGVLFADDGGSMDPVLIPDGGGGVFHSEIDIGITPYDCALAVAGRVDSTGRRLWGKILSRNTTPPSMSPCIIGDGVGGVIASWTMLWDSLYAQRLSPSGQELWRSGGISLGEYPADQALVPDETYGAICTWDNNRYGNIDIFARRVTGSGSVIWPVNGVPVRVAPGDQVNPKAVPDGAGGAIVVWEDGASGNRDIYAQRLDSTGARLWDTLGVPVIRSTGDQTGIQVVSDDAGGVIVTWQDLRVRNWNIYAQRLNPNGQRLWDTLGAEVCVWSGEQTVPVICSDGSGGAVIAWQDTRNGNSDIYVQCLSPSGSGVWEEVSPSHESRVTSYWAFPNPFFSFSSVPGHEKERFGLYDVSGRLVGTYRGDKVGWDAVPGVYFLKRDSRDSKPLRIVKVR